MDQREYQVASRPFAEAGTSIRTKLWYSRLNKLHAELLTDIPALRSLRASELELNFNPTAANVHLTAFLVESAQLSISYATKGREVDDLFLQDVSLVIRDQQRIEDRISQAISPSVNPIENSDVIEVRRRLKTLKRSGSVIIWTAPESTTLPLFELPKVLPVGFKSSVHVRVRKLTTAWADITLLENLDVGGQRVIERGTSMVLKRTGEHVHPPSGTLLQLAMDTKSSLQVEVVVVLEWDTGKPSCLELVSFVDGP